MSDANIINFALLVVTAIAAIVSIIAVVDARKSKEDATAEAGKARDAAERSAVAAEGIEAAMNRAAGAEKRLRRSELARDLMVWFDRSTHLMVLGPDAAVRDRAWVEAGEALNARARVIDSDGAVGLMQAAKRARGALEEVSPELRLEVAMNATGMLQLYAERWVVDGAAQSWPIEEWIRTDVDRIRGEQ
ncbi:hypothetical protein [Microbacterium oxydans]|uniref:hypothetical protein n=1 Tax=Microbacterium oxydans TaxID=82380 RepID=UPI00366FA965